MRNVLATKLNLGRLYDGSTGISVHKRKRPVHSPSGGESVVRGP